MKLIKTVPTLKVLSLVWKKFLKVDYNTMQYMQKVIDIGYNGNTEVETKKEMVRNTSANKWVKGLS